MGHGSPAVGSIQETIEKAIENGDIIRTHLLRPTWHIVSANDLRWMLELTAPLLCTSLRSRHKQLGITKDVVARCNKVIAETLAGSKQIIGKELVIRKDFRRA